MYTSTGSNFWGLENFIEINKIQNILFTKKKERKT